MMETGREPTPEELANELGITPERVREIYKIAQHPISLQAEVGDGGESQFGDFLEDTAPILLQKRPAIRSSKTK